MEQQTAHTGMVVHALITLLVAIGLVAINVFLAPEFPWSAFAVAGMTIGLAAHWWFGYHELEESVLARQRSIETRAATTR